MEQGITVLAFIRAREGKTQALGQALETLIDATRQEEGCISFEMHQSMDDPDLWFSYEHWRDEASQQAHFRTLHMRQFMKQQNQLVDGVFDLFHYQRMQPGQAPKVADNAAKALAGDAFGLSFLRSASGWAG